MDSQRILNYVEEKNASKLSPKSKSDRIFPYKLLQLPTVTASNLWNHNHVGDGVTLCFMNRMPHMVISKDALCLGRRLLVSGEKEVVGNLHGVVSYDKENNELTLCLRKLVTSPSSEFPSGSEAIASIHFSREMEEHSSSRDVAPLAGLSAKFVHCLEEWAETKGSLCFGHFVRARILCTCGEQRGCAVPFSLQVQLVTLDAVFHISPIQPLHIIPTALSKGLCDKKGNTFLHGEPKSGYLTMDELRRLLHILDTDPKVSSLPLVGIWVSGIGDLTDPFVWSACVRYLKIKFISQRLCRPPDPFLLLLYDTEIFQPQFYDCILTERELALSQSRCLQRVGRFKSTLDVSSSSRNGSTFKDDVIHILMCEPDICRNSDDVEIPTKWLTPRQRILFSTPITEEKVAGHVASPLVQPLFRMMTLSDSASRGASTSEQQQDKDRATASSEQLSQDIYQLLMAQEQTLKELRNQVNVLLKERSGPPAYQRADETLPTAAVSPARTRGGGDCVVSSASTMTSFEWPPVSRCSCQTRADRVAHAPSGSVGSRGHSSPSPQLEDANESVELVRCNTRSSPSCLDQIEDSLVNMQLSTFSDNSRSLQRSLTVDMHDFHQSFASSAQNPIAVNAGPLEICSRDTNPIFYDNLLRRIEAVLSRQSLVNGCTVVQAHKHCALINRSVFDSLFLPRLNYISLQLSDTDSDRSTQFGALASKYIVAGGKGETVCADRSGQLATLASTNVELSFATVQYLQKYRL